MEQSISGHIVRLLPGQNGAILLLDNAREIAANLDCMPKRCSSGSISATASGTARSLATSRRLTKALE
jgi:hypothetical protein